MENCTTTNHGFENPLYILIQGILPTKNADDLRDDCDKIGAKILSRLPWKLNRPQMWIVADTMNISLFIIKYADIVRGQLTQEKIEELLKKVKNVPDEKKLPLITDIVEYADRPSATQIIETAITLASIPHVFNKALGIVEKYAEELKKDNE